MKKIILLFSLLIVSTSIFAQTINCGSFCVLSIGNVDTMTNEMDVTIFNGDTNSVNYPSVMVVDNFSGDTIGNKGGAFFFFAHVAGDTVVHTIPCDTIVDSISSGFTGMVYITDNLWNITCGYSYPMTCTVGIPEIITGTNFSLYPNPAGEQVTISMSETGKQEVDIRIYDRIGKEVKNYTTSDSLFTIAREDLQSGLYFVTITVNGKRLTKKLIIK